MGTSVILMFNKTLSQTRPSIPQLEESTSQIYNKEIVSIKDLTNSHLLPRAIVLLLYGTQLLRIFFTVIIHALHFSRQLEYETMTILSSALNRYQIPTCCRT